MTRILIVGTGSMARAHAKAYVAMEGVSLVGAVDTNADNLAGFQSEFGIEHGFADLDQAIAWGDFDAVSNVTPDMAHHATTMPLIAAGKHVLCEKPLATNHDLAMEMTEAAEARGIVNMVNLTYRSGTAPSHARELVRQGAIGELRHFHASYLQSWLTAKNWGDWRTEPRWLWRLSTEHGSHGVVGDIGVHIVDLATFAARQDIRTVQSVTRTFHKAEGDQVGAYRLDANDSFTMMAELDGGALGVIHASRWATGHANDLSIDLFGTVGALRIRSTGTDSHLEICNGEDIHTQTWRSVDCPPTPSVYESFVTAIRTEEADGPSFRDAARTQRILDICLDAGDTGTAPVSIV